MLLWLLIFLVGSGIIYSHTKTNADGFDYFLWGIGSFISVGIIIVIIIALFSVPAEANCPIYSAALNTSISGSFVLGSGSFNSEIDYVFYTKSSDGTLSLNTCDSNTTKIELSDNTSPKIIYYDKLFDTKGLCKTMLWPLNYTYTTESQKIIVPSSAITEQYNLNLNTLN